MAQPNRVPARNAFSQLRGLSIRICCGNWLMIWTILPGTLAIGEFVHAEGACCTADECTQAAAPTECSAFNGVFLPDADCADGPCAPGACCSKVNCVEADAFNCIMGGRDYIGAGTLCVDNPCAIDLGACCTGEACGVSAGCGGTLLLKRQELFRLRQPIWPGLRWPGVPEGVRGWYSAC